MTPITKSVLESDIGIRFFLSIDVVTKTDLNNLQSLLEKVAPNLNWGYGEKVEVGKNKITKNAISAAFIPLNKNAVPNETCRNSLEVIASKVANHNDYYMNNIVGIEVLQRSLIEKSGDTYPVRKKKVS